MTAANAHSSIDVSEDAAPGLLARLDRRFERYGDWLNPILVKEVRQSLKSRQFGVVFFVVLVGAWAWSFLGVSGIGPTIHFRSVGAAMLMGYTWILLFPMVVVIPFMAFMSLASERDDGTFELVAVTTLRPRQIIAGRLATSTLQMIVFESLLAPCVAFTYLLRGVDLFLIAFLVIYAGGLCLVLTSISLFFATIGQSRTVNLLLAIPLLFGLGAIYFWLGGAIFELLRHGVGINYGAPQFWIAQLAIVSIVASFFVLFSVAATMMLTFSSRNRSTPLRLVMLAQQALAVGWGTWYLVGERNPGGLLVTLALGVLYWGFMGSLLIGESPHLHHRARRRLPQSFLGRTLLTWLFPGPGTGYVFATVNVWTLTAALLFAVEVAQNTTSRLATRSSFFHYFDEQHVWIVVLAACYTTAYLGTARLLLISCRKWLTPAPPIGLLLTALLVFVGTFGPTAISVSFETYSPSYGQYAYSPIHLPNFITTAAELERDSSPYRVTIIASVMSAAAVVVLANLALAGREVRRLREATPQRVLADDAIERSSAAKEPRAEGTTVS